MQDYKLPYLLSKKTCVLQHKSVLGKLKSLLTIIEEGQTDGPGQGSRNSLALEVGTVMDLVSSVDIMPAESISDIMLPHAVAMTEEEMNGKTIHFLPSSQAVTMEVTVLVAELDLPAGLKVYEPGFSLGVCDDPSFGPVVAEEGELSQSSDDDEGSSANITLEERVVLDL